MSRRKAAGATDGVVVCRPRSADEVEAGLVAATEEGTEVFVLVSSARVYGPDPRHDMLLDEDTPLAKQFDDPDLATLAEADRSCCEAATRGDGPRVVVLRTVHQLGPGAQGPLAEYLAAPAVRARFGFDPLMQLLHTDDVAAAVELAASSDVTGPFNVAGPGGLPLSVLVGAAGGSRITGPTGLLCDLAGEVGVDMVARMDERDLRYVLSVDDGRFREATGYEPSRSLSETVAALEEARVETGGA